MRIEDFVLVDMVILGAMAARAVILFGLLPLLTVLKLSPAGERPCRVASLLGGLRVSPRRDYSLLWISAIIGTVNTTSWMADAPCQRAGPGFSHG
ncbi:hypothetical protein NBRC116599_33460 [Aquicoccus sp. SU-CL01552]